MAVYSNTLDDLIEITLGTVMPPGCWYSGDCDASAVGTMVDATRYEEDDFFQNTVPQSWVYIRTTTDNAAPRGETRRITDWTQSSGSATCAPNFSAAPGAGDTYAIVNEYSWSETKDAINMAIYMARDRGLFVDKLDESVYLASDTYEYPIPEGFSYIYRISMADGDDNFQDSIPSDQWDIIRGASVPLIRLRTFAKNEKHEGHYYGSTWVSTSLADGRVLRIEGLECQTKLENDYDICKLSPEYISYMAGYILHNKRVKRRENDPDEHATQAAICLAQAEAAAKRTRGRLPANTRRVEL